MCGVCIILTVAEWKGKRGFGVVKNGMVGKTASFVKMQTFLECTSCSRGTGDMDWTDHYSLYSFVGACFIITLRVGLRALRTIDGDGQGFVF